MKIMRHGRGRLIDVSKTISNYEISPDGNRALFGTRGEIFTVPAKYGNARNITKTSGVHERNSKWSPDGKWIAYISDKSGEDEIYIHLLRMAGEMQYSYPPMEMFINTSWCGHPTARKLCGLTVCRDYII
jgi:tricorn protease-like protein